MARWHQDDVDVACEAWAFQWVNLFARQPLKSSEMVGRIGSTLELVKVLGDGAGGGGNAVQVYPEGFLGDGLVIACARHTMREQDRDLLWRHYVDRWYVVRVVPVKAPDGREIYEHTTTATHVNPNTGLVTVVRIVDRGRPLTQVLIDKRVRPVKQQTMAERLGISRAEYHTRRDRMKAYLHGVLDSRKCLDTKVGHEVGVLA